MTTTQVHHFTKSLATKQALGEFGLIIWSFAVVRLELHQNFLGFALFAFVFHLDFDSNGLIQSLVHHRAPVARDVVLFGS